MSIKGFEVGGVQAKYDYESLDNIPANLVQDANYVHTDNNYTNADKTKLSGIEAQANKTTIDATLTHSGQAADAKATGDAISALNAQVIASMPHDTASGSIASFPDGAAIPVIDCSVAVEPYQSGSGDPAPDNVRPISGWTECKVTRTGKNLWNPSFFTDNGFTENSGVYSGSSSDLNGVVLSIPPTDRAVMSLEYKGATTSRAGYFKFVYSDGSNNYPIDCKEDVWTTKTAVSTSGKTVIGITFSRSNTVNMEVRNFQLELGSAVSSYEPYQGQTYTIDLDGTRYGGTLDVTTGKLTVDRAFAEFDGSSDESWTHPANTIRFYIAVSDIDISTPDNIRSNLISNIYKTTPYNTSPSYAPSIASRYNIAQINVFDDAYADLTSFKSALSVNPLEICYELATPIEVDLTPTEITTLLGTNNIWADAGDTTVSYYADTTLFVNKKIAAAVAALP